MIRALPILASLLVTGCLDAVMVVATDSGVDGGPDGGMPDSGPPPLAIEDPICNAGELGVAFTEVNQNVECTFRVTGARGPVSYSCTDGEDQDLPCRHGQMEESGVDVQQEPPFPAGYDEWLLRMRAGGRPLVYEQDTLIIEVGDGTTTASLTVHVPVVAFSPAASPTTLRVACDGSTDLSYSVPAGQELHCLVYLADPDPPPVPPEPPLVYEVVAAEDYGIFFTAPPGPDHTYGVNPWILSPKSIDAGKYLEYTFTVPSSSETPSLTIGVTVQSPP